MMTKASARDGAAIVAAIVAAVRDCVGTRFRPQGRVPGIGLDCIGVALRAAAAAGLGGLAVPAYAIGGDNAGLLMPFLASCGCRCVGAAQLGDVLVVEPAPGQRHVAIVTSLGVVHAHAGLGRVVEGPIDPGWTIIAIWRFPGAG